MDLRIGDGLLSAVGSFIQIRRYGVGEDLFEAVEEFENVGRLSRKWRQRNGAKP